MLTRIVISPGNPWSQSRLTDSLGGRSTSHSGTVTAQNWTAELNCTLDEFWHQ